MADRILTPNFRLSYPSLFKAQSYQQGAAKFSATMLWPKSTDLGELRAACEKVITEAFPSGKLPNSFKGLDMLFRDGMEKADTDGYGPDIIFAKASANEDYPPELVGIERDVEKVLIPITNPRDLYAGAFCRAIVVPYVYNNVSQGVTLSLRCVQKVKDGTPFGGGGSVLGDLPDDVPVNDPLA